MALKVGDCVKLNSGSVIMTISRGPINNTSWVCAWMDAKGEAKETVYEEAALVKVECPEPDESKVKFAF